MELGKLVTYFEGDLTGFDKSLLTAERRLTSTKSTFQSITNDITGGLSQRLPVGGRYVNDLAGNFLRLNDSGDKAGQGAKRLVSDLKSLEDQALRIRNRFSDFNEQLRISFGGKIDSDFLKQFRAAEGDAQKLSLLTKRFDGDAAKMVTSVERSAFQFAKLERDGGAALSAVEKKALLARRELAQMEQGAASAGSGMALMGGPVGIAAAAIATLAAIEVAAVVGLFNLSKATAEYAGHLHDLNQQTGISVETLSVLKVNAETSGSSIDSINGKFARYLKQVSDANHGNKQAADSFRQVGIDAKKAFESPDEAIRLLIRRIGELSNDEDRLNALQKVGIKNGQEVNALIKEMGGDLDRARRAAEEMGLVITPEQAKAADKFGDSLHLLELQLKGLGYTVGQRVMPAFQEAVDGISTSLKENRDDWELWGDGVKMALSYVLFQFKAAKWVFDNNPLIAVIKYVRGTSAQSIDEMGGDGIANALTNTFDPISIDDKEGKNTGGESAARRAARQQLQLAEVDLQTARRVASEKLEDEQRNFQQSLTALELYTRKRIKIAEELYAKEKEVFQKERDEIDASRLEQGEKDVRLRQLKEKEDAAKSEYERKVGRNGEGGLYRSEEDQRRREIQKAHMEAELRLKQANNAALDQLERAAAEKGLQTFQEYEEARYARAIDALSDLRAIKQQELELMTNDPDLRRGLNDEIKAINEEQLRLQKQHLIEMAEARVADLQSAQEYTNRLRALAAETVTVNQETLEVQLRALAGNTLAREDFIRRTAELEKAQEAERSRLALATLEDQRTILREEINAMRQLVDERAKLKQNSADDLEAANKYERERLTIITEIDKQIVAEKRKSAAIQEEIERERQEKILEKWREISQDISSALADAIDAGIEHGGRGALDSLGRYALETIRAIERELLDSLIMQILQPGAPSQGSQAGGIVGAITNKILGLFTKGKKGADSPEEANTKSVTINTEATDRNTEALNRLSQSVGQESLQTQNLNSTMQQLASSSTRSGGGGFWSGLLNAIVGGAISGLTGGLSFGSEGGGGPQGRGSNGPITDIETGVIIDPGTTPPHRAAGGRGYAGELYEVNELGLEYFRPDVDGEFIPHGTPLEFNNQQSQHGGGQTVNFHAGAINIPIHLPPGSNPNNFPGQNRRIITEAVADGMNQALSNKYGAN